jgi:hypothetical protein
MAQENLGKVLTFAASLTTHVQFTFMRVGAARAISVPASGGDADGVLQNNPKIIGSAADLCLSGSMTKVVAGAAIADGASVASDNQGRAVPAATGGVVLGKALSAAGVAGDVITILFQKGGRIAP